ncbi:septation ring formation regulator [Evansella vedderi]|uniref:Septation ring formation regulator EzrA n=1 Tax=Evansella vedderi TaxID=38282 RepID=A0ABT9ZUT9_9BACI|nr:septation ring formation regulator EzrA [Evansella vedderi]MDQ0255013.1 septation ring formation regulator [Evansella vedderi]
MFIVYGLIVLVIVIVIYGAWSRRSIYKEVDKLESKKIQLMNEPVTEELSKIKGLKMSGETEERFEEWRSAWDEIVTVQLPNIEEKLFDIEELANKYRFNKAKRVARFVDDELKKIKDHLHEMVAEVDQLVQSEEQNRQDIHSVKDLFQETKKKLWAQKGTLGNTGTSIERRLKSAQEKFHSFDEETEKGNYLQAREILFHLQEELKYLNEMMEKTPQYLVLIDKELPKQIEDLNKGLLEMEQNGYNLEHFSFKWQTAEMKRRLLAILPLVENLKLNEAVEPIEFIQKEIDDIYEKLEQEVISRQQVEKELPHLQGRMEILPNEYQELRVDTEMVKMSYRISEEEDRKQLKLDKGLKDLTNQYAVILDTVQEQKQSYTALREVLQDFQGKLRQVEKEMEEARERLNHLRRDERTAEETLLQLKEKLLFGHKKLKKSNLPGVPEALLLELDEAERALYLASEKLNELPLAIEEVMIKVDEAKEHVEQCIEKLLKVIEEASLAERVIQYGNRYRRQNDQLNIQLLQAEDYFRHYEYEEALEKALMAIEPIDPDVLEKVSNYQSPQTTS